MASPSGRRLKFWTSKQGRILKNVRTLLEKTRVHDALSKLETYKIRWCLNNVPFKWRLEDSVSILSEESGVEQSRRKWAPKADLMPLVGNLRLG